MISVDVHMQAVDMKQGLYIAFIKQLVYNDRPDLKLKIRL